ncbi:hypothetical protein Droror1_Dr00005632 [Drosera rotundifolia]
MLRPSMLDISTEQRIQLRKWTKNYAVTRVQTGVALSEVKPTGYRLRKDHGVYLGIQFFLKDWCNVKFRVPITIFSSTVSFLYLNWEVRVSSLTNSNSDVNFPL